MKKVRLLSIGVFCLFAVLGSVVFVSCGEDDPIDEYVCETTDAGYGDYDICCNTTECYYMWDGQKYECDGTDCEATGKELAADMVASAEKSASIDGCEISVEELTQRILMLN